MLFPHLPSPDNAPSPMGHANETIGVLREGFTWGHAEGGGVDEIASGSVRFLPVSDFNAIVKPSTSPLSLRIEFV